MLARKGFTLIEILVVVTILAIAAVIVAPSIGGGYDSIRVPSAGRMVLADLLYAQNEAITRQARTYVVFQGSAGNYTGYLVGTVPSPNASTSLNRPGDGGPMSATFGATSDKGPFQRSKISALSGLGTQTTLAFGSLGQPLCSSDGTNWTDLTQEAKITLSSMDGKTTVELNVQPFTGEVTVDGR